MGSFCSLENAVSHVYLPSFSDSGVIKELQLLRDGKSTPVAMTAAVATSGKKKSKAKAVASHAGNTSIRR